MPELPEVETIRRDLERDIKGRKVTDVEIFNPRVIKEPRPVEFQRRLKGVVFEEFLRRAKVLAVRLSTGDFLVVHLRMTGQLIYSAKKEAKARVVFILSDGKYLNFNDQRLFAELRLVPDWQELKFVRELGIEPLDKAFTADKFQEMLQGKRTRIKPLLMDQTFIAGIGNLYVQEALFLAGILPGRTADKLSSGEIEKLHNAVQRVLREGIEYRGSSVDDYVNGRGEQGKYQLRLKVYDRAGKCCVVCRQKIQKVRMGGRGTCFCPQCQK